MVVVNNINLTKLTTGTPHPIAAINYCLHHLYTWVSCATAALPTMSANCIQSELVVCRAVTRPLFFHTGQTSVVILSPSPCGVRSPFNTSHPAANGNLEFSGVQIYWPFLIPQPGSGGTSGAHSVAGREMVSPPASS